MSYCARTPQLRSSKKDRSSVPLLIFDEGRLTVLRGQDQGRPAAQCEGPEPVCDDHRYGLQDD